MPIYVVVDTVINRTVMGIVVTTRHDIPTVCVVIHLVDVQPLMNIADNVVPRDITLVPQHSTPEIGR